MALLPLTSLILKKENFSMVDYCGTFRMFSILCGQILANTSAPNLHLRSSITESNGSRNPFIFLFYEVSILPCRQTSPLLFLNCFACVHTCGLGMYQVSISVSVSFVKVQKSTESLQMSGIATDERLIALCSCIHVP